MVILVDTNIIMDIIANREPVISYNRKLLERELANESRQQSIHRIDYRQQTVCKIVGRVKRREEEI